MKVVNVFRVFSSIGIGWLCSIVYIGSCIGVLCFSVCLKLGVLWMFNCIYRLRLISSVLVMNGMC